MSKKPICTNLKTIFEHIELPAKLLDYFLRSNKSNINQMQLGRENMHEAYQDVHACIFTLRQCMIRPHKAQSVIFIPGSGLPGMKIIQNLKLPGMEIW